MRLPDICWLRAVADDKLEAVKSWKAAMATYNSSGAAMDAGPAGDSSELSIQQANVREHRTPHAVCVNLALTPRHAFSALCAFACWLACFLLLSYVCDIYFSVRM